jgi:hypothetical protein
MSQVGIKPTISYIYIYIYIYIYMCDFSSLRVKIIMNMMTNFKIKASDLTRLDIKYGHKLFDPKGSGHLYC